MHIMRQILRLIWSSIGVLRRFLIILLLLASLALNVAIVLSSAVASLASSAVSAVTGARTVFLQQADEIAELSTTVDVERVANRELRSEVATTTADLNTERLAHRQTRQQLGAMSADLATSSRVIRSEGREAAAEIIEGISERTARTARREVAAMSAEAIPFWGTAIIVAATTLELRDMCQNIQDLDDLHRLLNPSADELEQDLTVCSMSVPTRNEIWEAARRSPQQVWSTARDAMPTADEIRAMDLPEINWTDLGASISGTSREWADTATSAASEAGDWFARWWNE